MTAKLTCTTTEFLIGFMKVVHFVSGSKTLHFVTGTQRKYLLLTMLSGGHLMVSGSSTLASMTL